MWYFYFFFQEDVVSSHGHKLKHHHQKDAKHEYYLRKHLEEAEIDTKTVEKHGATPKDARLQLDGNPEEEDKFHDIASELKEIEMQNIHPEMNPVNDEAPIRSSKVSRSTETVDEASEGVKETSSSSVPPKKTSSSNKSSSTKVEEKKSSMKKKVSEASEVKEEKEMSLDQEEGKKTKEATIPKKPSNKEKNQKGKGKGKENKKKNQSKNGKHDKNGKNGKNKNNKNKNGKDGKKKKGEEKSKKSKMNWIIRDKKEVEIVWTFTRTSSMYCEYSGER